MVYILMINMVSRVMLLCIVVVMLVMQFVVVYTLICVLMHALAVTPMLMLIMMMWRGRCVCEDVDDDVAVGNDGEYAVYVGVGGDVTVDIIGHTVWSYVYMEDDVGVCVGVAGNVAIVSCGCVCVNVGIRMYVLHVSSLLLVVLMQVL